MSDSWDFSFLGAGPIEGADGGSRTSADLLATGVGLGYGGSSAGVSHGLNVGACREVHGLLGIDAESLADVVRAGEYAVRRICEEWQGPDAEEFLHAWKTSRRELSTAIEAILDMRRRLDIAIDRQELASRT